MVQQKEEELSSLQSDGLTGRTPEGDVLRVREVWVRLTTLVRVCSWGQSRPSVVESAVKLCGVCSVFVGLSLFLSLPLSLSLSPSLSLSLSLSLCPSRSRSHGVPASL
jgi:hypothetical protein